MNPNRRAACRRLQIYIRWVMAFLLGLFSLSAAAQTSHPRLWLRSNDVARLQSWANPNNPLYTNGLAVQAAEAKTAMDTIDGQLTPPAPDVPFADDGQRSYQSYPTEQYAELFAFMSLISSNAAEKADYARRATNLLMYAINKALP